MLPSPHEKQPEVLRLQLFGLKHASVPPEKPWVWQVLLPSCAALQLAP
ncbi:MAG: hypothetical protein HC927_12850 [Deltaproteobacteria bacterium]|nr:hypothetical protein [Deltaproteobacteria bacterium]